MGWRAKSKNYSCKLKDIHAPAQKNHTGRKLLTKTSKIPHLPPPSPSRLHNLIAWHALQEQRQGTRVKERAKKGASNFSAFQ